MVQVAGWIADVLDSQGAPEVVERTRLAVLDLCQRFPVYGT
jgi:glycine/serine hydroxymethyltransferase